MSLSTLVVLSVQKKNYKIACFFFVGALKLKKPPQIGTASIRTRPTTEPLQTDRPATQRPTLKYKTIDRPNIKALYPGLHSRPAVAEDATEIDSMDQSDSITDAVATDVPNMKSITANVPAIRTATPLKFNSKIRSTGNRNVTVPSNTRPQTTAPLSFDAPRTLAQQRSLPVNSRTFLFA